MATRLASSNAGEAAAYLSQLDRDVTRLGRLVRSPAGVFVRLGLLVIRLRESNDIPRIIDVLSQM